MPIKNPDKDINFPKGRVQKKKTEKSDIVHIWVLSHPTLSISDIQFRGDFRKMKQMI